MARVVTWVIMLPVAVVVIILAVSNRGAVRLDFDPFPFVAEAPLFVVVLVAILIGFVWGGLVAWGSGSTTRRALAAMTRQLDRVSRDLGAARDEVAVLASKVSRLETARRDPAVPVLPVATRGPDAA